MQQKRFITVLIIIAILGLSVTTGVFYLKNQSISLTSTDLTKNWKTYTNSKYKVMFQYPKEAALKVVSNNPGIYFLKVIFTGKKQVNPNLTDGYVIDIIFGDYQSNIASAADNYNRLQSQCLKTATIGKVVSTTFADRPAQMLTVENCSGNNANTTYYYMSLLKEGVMEISPSISGELPDKSIYAKTIRQILSTFKFTQ